MVSTRASSVALRDRDRDSGDTRSESDRDRAPAAIPLPAVAPTPKKRKAKKAQQQSPSSSRQATPVPSAPPAPSPPQAQPITSITKRQNTTTTMSDPGWSHAPSRLALAWLAVSVPLVLWDSAYVLLRPLTMPGGSLHRPLWVPYALYGQVDHMYGVKQWVAGNGFTAAQSIVNLVESLLYVVYVALWWFNAQSLPAQKRGAGRRVVSGRLGAWTALVGFSAAVMTVSKTAVYCRLSPPPPWRSGGLCEASVGLWSTCETGAD